MIYIDDNSGSNIDVQLIDLSKTDLANSPFSSISYKGNDVLMVFDYAFGEQAFEIMDELLRPFEYNNNTYTMNVKSVSIMGKAGILTGEKGDIMIPTSHIFEGTADNYPFENALKLEDFKMKNKSFRRKYAYRIGNFATKQRHPFLFYEQFLENSWSRNGRRTLPKSNSNCF
jgi:hypothetical protein